MKFEMQPDGSLICKCEELTVDEVEMLKATAFVEDVPVNFHSGTITQEALIPFFRFFSTLKCLYITLYFENLDLETARVIYQVAKQNHRPLKMQLDLGEKILAFICAAVLSPQEAQDIEDHLLSGVYKNLHTLVIEQRSMTYAQAIKLLRALRPVSLKSLEISCEWLDEATKDYIKKGLIQQQSIPTVTFLIKDIVQFAVIEEPVIEPSVPLKPVVQSAVEPVVDPVVQLDAESFSEPHCLRRALTWMWSKIPCAKQSDTVKMDEAHKPGFHLKNP